MFFPISTYEFSHSILGLLFYCVPVALITYFLFEYIGKYFLIDISPLWVRQKLALYRNTNPRVTLGNIAALIAATIIGGISHIIWDAFTHNSGWGLQFFPALASDLKLFSYSVPYFKLVQYGSSIIGLPLLVIFAVFYLKKGGSQATIEGITLSFNCRFAIVFSFMLATALVAYFNFSYSSEIMYVLGRTIKQSIAIGIVLFFAYSFLYMFYMRIYLGNPVK